MASCKRGAVCCGALRTVALAIRNEEFQDGRIFDAQEVAAFRESALPIALPFVYLGSIARERGFDLITADQVATRGVRARDVLLMAYDRTPASDALLAAGARAAVLLSSEPPVIAWELCFHLRRLSARFPHTFAFAGGARRASPCTTFHPLLFPQSHVPRTGEPIPWRGRRHLVMINSNKAIVRSLARWFDRPREVSLKRAVATLLYPPIGRDLYRERLRAISALADRPGFDLYGEGWQRRHPAVAPRTHATALRAYRGTATGKLETLARYQFTLCIENTAFPGYVSEKIFDCFFAGTVPAYLGAPNIERYVPRETFIDLRQFRDYADLERSLLALTEAEAQRCLAAARGYLASSEFQQFSAGAFARAVVTALESVAQR